MNHKEFYNQFKYSKNIENENEVIQTAKNYLNGMLGDPEKKLIEKIENSIFRGALVNVNLNLVISEIINKNPFALSIFKKDPTRQNISELCQIEFISKYKKLNIKKHSENLRFVKDGTKLISEKIAGAVSKSFDFDLNFDDGQKALGIGKTTFNVGGHQDNVEEEIISFLERMNTYNRFNEEQIKFFILLDGDYWNETIIKKLKRFETNYIKVFSSDNIVYF